MAEYKRRKIFASVTPPDENNLWLAPISNSDKVVLKYFSAGGWKDVGIEQDKLVMLITDIQNSLNQHISDYDQLVIIVNNLKEELSSTTDELKELIEAEAETRESADNTLQDAIDAEAKSRETADSDLQDAIDAEAKAREEDDDALQESINDEVTARKEADESLQDAIDAEAKTREEADNDLQDAIDAEAKTREEADNDLQDAIDAEAKTREEADNDLQDAIDAEAKTREEADEVLEDLIMALYPAIGYYASTKSTSSATESNIGDESIVKYLGTTYSTTSSDADYWDEDTYDYLWYYNGSSWSLANRKIVEEDTYRIFIASTSRKTDSSGETNSNGTYYYPAGFICVYQATDTAVYEKYWGKTYFIPTSSADSTAEDDFDTIKAILTDNATNVSDIVNQYTFIEDYPYIWYYDCEDYQSSTIATFLSKISYNNIVYSNIVSTANSNFVDNATVSTFGLRNSYNLSANWKFYAGDTAVSDTDLVSISSYGPIENWENPFWVEKFLLNCIYIFYETNPEIYSSVLDRLRSANLTDNAGSFHIRGGMGGYCDVYLGNLREPGEDYSTDGTTSDYLFSSEMRFSGQVQYMLTTQVPIYTASGEGTSTTQHLTVEFMTGAVYVKGLNGSNVDEDALVKEKQVKSSDVLDMFELGMGTSTDDDGNTTYVTRRVSVKVSDLYNNTITNIVITKTDEDSDTVSTSNPLEKIHSSVYNTKVSDPIAGTSTSYTWTRTLTYTYTDADMDTLDSITEAYTVETT